MSWGDGRIRAGQNERQPFRVAAVRFHMDERALHDAYPAAVRAVANGVR
jgi:hypothetical protein